jgi:transcriptional regulator with XRE-family HTH domain
MTDNEKTIDQYLDEAKKKLGITSDYKLAIEWNIARSGITNYRKGERKPDNYVIFKIAETLEIDEKELTIKIEAMNEKNQIRKEFWSEQLQKLKGGLARLRIIGMLYVTSAWCEMLLHHADFI